jgi:hypothetical protein
MMQIEIFDDDDGCTYTLDFSVEDASNLYNMQTLHKVHLELPSIGGNAAISNDDVIIMYKNGNNGHGSIGVTLPTLQKIIDAAMKDRPHADNGDD